MTHLGHLAGPVTTLAAALTLGLLAAPETVRAQDRSATTLESAPLPTVQPMPAEAQQSAQPSNPEIIWRLVNPFRLFVDPASTDLHIETYEKLDEQQRANAVFEAERFLSGRFAKGWGEATFRQICWDPDTNQYKCKTTPDYLAPKSHRVIVELRGMPQRVSDAADAASSNTQR